MTTPQQNKHQLLNLLKIQRQHYESALQLLVSNDGTQVSGKATAAATVIQNNMAELKLVDQQIAQLQPVLRNAGVLREPDMQSVLVEHEQTLKSLIQRLDTALGHAGQQQTVLTQSLDGGAQRMSAQEAYRISLKTG